MQLTLLLRNILNFNLKLVRWRSFHKLKMLPLWFKEAW
jgi:hypothetical protein